MSLLASLKLQFKASCEYAYDIDIDGEELRSPLGVSEHIPSLEWKHLESIISLTSSEAGDTELWQQFKQYYASKMGVTSATLQELIDFRSNEHKRIQLYKTHPATRLLDFFGFPVRLMTTAFLPTKTSQAAIDAVAQRLGAKPGLTETELKNVSYIGKSIWPYDSALDAAFGLEFTPLLFFINFLRNMSGIQENASSGRMAWNIIKSPIVIAWNVAMLPFRLAINLAKFVMVVAPKFLASLLKIDKDSLTEHEGQLNDVEWDFHQYYKDHPTTKVLEFFFPVDRVTTAVRKQGRLDGKSLFINFLRNFSGIEENVSSSRMAWNIIKSPVVIFWNIATLPIRFLVKLRYVMEMLADPLPLSGSLSEKVRYALGPLHTPLVKIPVTILKFLLFTLPYYSLQLLALIGKILTSPMAIIRPLIKDITSENMHPIGKALHTFLLALTIATLIGFYAFAFPIALKLSLTWLATAPVGAWASTAYTWATSLPTVGPWIGQGLGLLAQNIQVMFAYLAPTAEALGVYINTILALLSIPSLAPMVTGFAAAIGVFTVAVGCVFSEVTDKINDWYHSGQLTQPSATSQPKAVAHAPSTQNPQPSTDVQLAAIPPPAQPSASADTGASVGSPTAALLPSGSDVRTLRTVGAFPDPAEDISHTLGFAKSTQPNLQ